MILQLEIFWLCQALMYLLKERPLRMRRLELLSEHLHLRCANAAVALEDIRQLGLELLKARPLKDVYGDPAHDPELQGAGMNLRDYAQTMGVLINNIDQVASRAQILSVATDDAYLHNKLSVLFSNLAVLIREMECLGWDSPFNVTIPATKKGYMLCAWGQNGYALYPQNIWGCYCLQDKVWADIRSAESGENIKEAAALQISPLEFLDRMNVPNYILWAYILQTYDEKHSAMKLTCTENAVASIIAATTEEDKSGVEDNSPFPPKDKWARVKVCLPKDARFPNINTKTRETRYDILADKNQVCNIQMFLMSL